MKAEFSGKKKLSKTKIRTGAQYESSPILGWDHKSLLVTIVVLINTKTATYVKLYNAPSSLIYLDH